VVVASNFVVGINFVIVFGKFEAIWILDCGGRVLIVDSCDSWGSFTDEPYNQK
jgi:hypothetical protein